MITTLQTSQNKLNYVRMFSTGDILRSSLKIYWSNFKTFWIIAALPLLPVAFLQTMAESTGHMWVVITVQLLATLAGLVITAAATVAVSDICLRQEPSVGRSYRLAFSEMPLKIVGTGCLVWAVLILGFVFLLVPGLIFSLWYLFAIPLVVLEQTSGVAALRRSRHLGKGCYMRNSAVYLLLIIVIGFPFFLLMFSVGSLIGLIGALLDMDEKWTLGLSMFSGGTLGATLAPILTIGIVLLYYDMRVRKEAYNIQALAEELRR